jgi:hypothetical protein
MPTGIPLLENPAGTVNAGKPRKLGRTSVASEERNERAQIVRTFTCDFLEARHRNGHHRRMQQVNRA